jgi:hypothetical protein
MTFITTVHTDKQGLTAPIALVNLSILAAFLAGMFRVNRGHQNPGKLALVIQELPELVESPIAVSGSLLLANPCPPVDAFQIFDDNRTLLGLCKIKQPQPNAVFHILVKPVCLPTSCLSQHLADLVQLGANVFRDVLRTAQLRQLFTCSKYCAAMLKPRMNFCGAILRPHRLQDPPAPLEPPPFFFYLAGTLGHTISGDRDVGDSHVDPDAT